MPDGALPRADRAVVPREKLEGYLLNPRHEVGRHKARVFVAALGIHQADWAYLRTQIEAGIVDAPVGSVRDTQWGRLYEVLVPIEGLNGQTRRVMTVWLVTLESDEPPRFVTGYVVDEPSGA
jgi:filamentous hemagglutinin